MIGNTEPLENIASILFDLDGTLVDTVDLICRSFDHAVRKVLGVELSRAELLQNMGRPLAVQMRHFSETRSAELLEAYNEHNLVAHDQNISAYPGTVDILDWLKSQKGMHLGVVTSKKRDLCLRGLKITGLLDYFTIIIAMEDTSRHKPEPEPVLAALAALGQEPVESVFIGDSPFDIIAGNRAGLSTGAALWGPFPEDLLRETRPDFELRSLAQIRTVIA